MEKQENGGKSATGYDASSIRVLKGLEGVRKRPAMYIGDTGKRGFHHILEEVVDNAIDEYLAGHCTSVKVTLNSDGSASVEDNGRGIPVDKHPEIGKPALEVVMTTLHAGGKFDAKSYRISGGLHGVGVSVTNALSEWFRAEVMRDGSAYVQEYVRGSPKGPMKKTGDTEETGTKITFKPDSEMFSEKDFDFELLSGRLEELSYLNAGLEILLSDQRTGKEEKYLHEGGLKTYVKHLNRTRTAIHPEPIYFEQKGDKYELQVSMQYTDGYLKTIYSFVNGINTIEGGTHEEGWRTALTRALNRHMDDREKIQLRGDDVREGLTAVISLRLQDPQFEGQTKTKLGNSEMKGVVSGITYEKICEFLEENPQVRNVIITKVQEAARAREAARKAKELVRRKSAFSTGSLPGKLADCQVRNPEEAEIFIVEGDSAGGCFSGDTMVALADGRNVSFRDLVKEDGQGKKNYCYTIKKDGSVGLGLIKHPRVTRKDADVVKLVLDNNEDIVCTPDHKFMLRDYGFKRADSIGTGDSIMPLNRKMSKIGGRITIKGYEMVLDPKTHKWIFTHLLADRYNLEQKKYEESSGKHKHHIDFNKLNNSPENIIRMKNDEHMMLHSRIFEKNHKKMIERSAKARKNPEYRKKMSRIMSSPVMREMLSERAKRQWQNGEYKKYMTGKFLEFYSKNKEYREKTLKRLNAAQKKYWSDGENRKAQSERTKRHFENNPQARQALSEISTKQWQDEELRRWRSEETARQWTNDFRQKRKGAYNRTYFNRTISFMKRVFDEEGTLKNYREKRIASRDKNLLRMDTFAQRFFDNDFEAMSESVRNYNHKIKKIVKLRRKMDVYDLEVEGTHNFALSSGVFVHNSSKQGRDRRTQAVLPLRGKILNTEKARIDKIYENNEISSMITAIGTGINDECEPSKSRYGKIMMLADSDVDGNHIVTLILTFFYRYMRPLIDAGKIYVAKAPLYRLKHKGKVTYVFDEKEKARMLKEMGEKDVLVQRFKGLGEMNPEQLWETTLNPATRHLKQITIEDAIAADEVFSTLMGKEVVPRREFIIKYSDSVKNLDV